MRKYNTFFPSECGCVMYFCVIIWREALPIAMIADFSYNMGLSW